MSMNRNCLVIVLWKCYSGFSGERGSGGIRMGLSPIALGGLLSSVFFKENFPKKNDFFIFFGKIAAKRRIFFGDFCLFFLGKSARSADFAKKNEIWAKTIFFGEKSGFFGENSFFLGFFFGKIQVPKKSIFFGKIIKTLKKTLALATRRAD